MKTSTTILAAAIITALSSLAQAGAPARQPGIPPRQPGQPATFECQVDTNQVVLEEVANAIGTWKDLGKDSLQTEEGRKQYETNAAIFGLLVNPQSTLYKLIKASCADKSK